MTMTSLTACLLLLLLVRGVDTSSFDHGKRMEFIRAMDEATERQGNLRDLSSRLLEKARPVEHDIRQLEQANDDDDGNDDDEVKLNVDDYAIKYAGCQQIQTWSDNKAADEDSDTVFSMQRFVVFRLCPAEHCSTYNSHGCNSNYGEYMIAMEDYLAIMAQYHYARFDAYCSTCATCMSYEQQQVAYQYKAQHGGNNNRGRNLAYDDVYYNYYNRYNNDDDAGDDAAGDDAYAAGDDGGGDDAYAAGDDAYAAGDDAYAAGDDAAGDDAYAAGDDAAGDDAKTDDAAYYAYYDDDLYKDDDSAGGSGTSYGYCRYSTSCYNYQSVCRDYDENHMDFANYFSCTEFVYGNEVVYLGPHCNGDGFTMTLGIYNDDECSEYLGDITNEEQFTGISFNEDSLSFYYPKTCIACADQGEWTLKNNNGGGGGDEYASYLCEALYETSAKCHKYLSSDEDAYESENQEQTDGSVCEFIQSLEDNNYDEDGLINLANQYFDRSKWTDYQQYTKFVSPLQIFLLVVSISLFFGLAFYSCCVHNALSRVQRALRDKNAPNHDFSNSLLYHQRKPDVRDEDRVMRIPSGITKHRSFGDSHSFDTRESSRQKTWATVNSSLS